MDLGNSPHLVGEPYGVDKTAGIIFVHNRLS
jgi:hypothetical protein